LKQMSKLLLLPPSVISNSALVNSLSQGEVCPPCAQYQLQRSCTRLTCRSFQIQAACSAGHSTAAVSSCSDAIQIVRQLCVSAALSGDIENWKLALLEESDVDAPHVEAIVQSVQVVRFNQQSLTLLTPCRPLPTPTLAFV
jgi:hypothetical protein